MFAQPVWCFQVQSRACACLRPCQRHKMISPVVFSKQHISSNISSYLRYESICHATTASKAMQYSGVVVMPQKVCLHALPLRLLRFDCSDVTHIDVNMVRGKGDHSINEWLCVCLSKCNVVEHIGFAFCKYLTDVGLQATTRLCRQITSIGIQDCSRI